jgi:ribonucleoside-triphosphate reductase
MDCDIVTRLHDLIGDTPWGREAKRGNANIDGQTAMGGMLLIGSYCSSMLALSMIRKENPSVADAHVKGDIHIHDIDFYPMGTLTCLQIDMGPLLDNGFSTGHGMVPPARDILSYAHHACLILQSNQNEMHGGQSIPDFDYLMAKGVQLSLIHYSLDHDAWDRTMDDTRRAMTSMIMTLNTMHSRAGAQVPFTSINFGTDTSSAGRMVTRCMLESLYDGMGGETPLFPISVFKVKDGINYRTGDTNYDLFILAMKVSAKRLLPNFLFLDQPYNLMYYRDGDPRSEVATMGCRTRVMSSVHDDSDGTTFKRGNLSFTTINLVRIGFSRDWGTFYSTLTSMMDMTRDQLLIRMEYQGRKRVSNFPFLMGEKLWFGSEGLKDEIKGALVHGTLSIGFIGLAETLILMTGHHHGEDELSRMKGVEIVSFMRRRCDTYSQEYGVNFTLLATPAEGLSGRFTSLDREIYGVVEGVTDKEYYTNSFHVPVKYPISIHDKLVIEGEYHSLCNAGHISYVEVDGLIEDNIDAFQSILVMMKDSGVGYGAINHPVDRDPSCGYTGVIYDKCPRCGREEGTTPFSRIRRITGYLVGGLDRWNKAKRAEEKDRVKHQ